ncbi:hypothetical protein MBAV_003256, partial [Candidatus Magnetobacterium bavaricum]
DSDATVSTGPWHLKLDASIHNVTTDGAKLLTIPAGYIIEHCDAYVETKDAGIALTADIGSTDAASNWFNDVALGTTAAAVKTPLASSVTEGVTAVVSNGTTVGLFIKPSATMTTGVIHFILRGVKLYNPAPLTWP